MTRVRCEGWWEQDGYGRQPMEQLEISCEDDRLLGTGTDIVGPFRLDGVCRQDRVAIVKQYIGQHHVEYYGVSDGEGTMYGDWGWGGYLGGKWLIRITRAASGEREEILDVTESLVAQAKAEQK